MKNVRVSSFGSRVGSLANLIGYTIYIDHYSTNERLSFTIHFLLMGFAAFLIGVALFFELN